MQHLGGLIAQDRQRLGLSQAELARQLGVSQQSVSKWEEGTARPRGKRLAQLVRALGGKESQTAAAVTPILGSLNNNRRETPMDAAHTLELQAQALATLARAAEDIARAAQALADSVTSIAKTPPPQNKH